MSRLGVQNMQLRKAPSVVAFGGTTSTSTAGSTEPTSMTEFSFDFDDADLSLETIQSMVYEEIMNL